LIPGYNDSLENLRHIAKFVKRLSNVEKVSLLPYNSAAGAKYRFIGKNYGLEYVKENTREEELSFLDIFSSSGLKVEIGR
jgi:pyruvate formate lyase activating enzyme